MSGGCKWPIVVKRNLKIEENVVSECTICYPVPYVRLLNST